MASSLSVQMLSAVALLLAAANATTVELTDPARNRTVSAMLCGLEPRPQSLLIVFGHGGGLLPDDYHWLCHAPGLVALAQPNHGDDPTDLRLMSADMSFLASALPVQNRSNRSSPVFNQLASDALLTVAGHSMGGAAAFIAAANMIEARAALSGVLALAPGVYGSAQISEIREAVIRVNVPSLLLVGDRDCCNEAHRQTLPIFQNISTPEKILAVVAHALFGSGELCVRTRCQRVQIIAIGAVLWLGAVT